MPYTDRVGTCDFCQKVRRIKTFDRIRKKFDGSQEEKTIRCCMKCEIQGFIDVD